jgi:hypothetical protein
MKSRYPVLTSATVGDSAVSGLLSICHLVEYAANTPPG